MPKKQKVAIICGGPSAERGISLNSARSIYDNLNKEKYDISVIYYNPQLEPYQIQPSQIYSNTPLDFDFKLKDSKSKLSPEKLKHFLSHIDIALPAIHGLFGEDGQLQKILEKNKVRYIGSGPDACYNTSDKFICQKILKEHGFYTVPNWILRKGDSLPSLPRGEYVIKPLHGGSSIGVHYFKSEEELKEKLNHVFIHEDESIIEPLCIGKEFTIIVLENPDGEPVSLLPTEIEFSQDRFFDYRKKYLASTDTRYYTPARYNKETIDLIRKESARAFKCLGMKDFGRIDGWIMPDGKIWLSDINAISGMEQNSFFFQQAALLGLSHGQLLDYVITKKVCGKSSTRPKREKIPVIFGGKTAERQISLISGTNVWIKLRTSKKYLPVPLVLTRKKEIFEIPQFLCLHHTVEEIEEKITYLKKNKNFENIKKLANPVLKLLKIKEADLLEKLFIPRKTSLSEIGKKYRFLFLGLHGGEGEDGTIQKKLDNMKLPYNGPGAVSSRLCMDKFETGKIIQNANIPGISVAKKVLLNIEEDLEKSWKTIKENGLKMPLIIKPRGDGCSAGVIRIGTYDHFRTTIEYFKSDHKFIPEKAIHENHGKIELPHNKIKEILVEEFIKTDKVNLENLKIEWETVNNMIEVTIGVMGAKNSLKVFYPSQTIASQEILSLEEKFMGGTGINLTPPPAPYVKIEAIKRAQKNLKKVAETLYIEGYSRIDTFMDIKTGDLIIIEANTLPGLTPSTVIYHQALAEKPPMEPLKFIENIIEIGKSRFEITKPAINKNIKTKIKKV